jgi:hypothetical protein
MKIFASRSSIRKIFSALCFLFLLINISCDRKELRPRLVIDTPQLDLKYDQEHQFTLSEGGAVLEPNMFAWKSDDETVGAVDEKGKFTARRVGETTVRAVSSDGETKIESKVTVTPYSLLYTEPVLLWGASQAQVKAGEKRKVFESTPYYLAFTGETTLVTKAEYYFSLDQRLSSANIYLGNTPEAYEEAVLYLKERYPDNFTYHNTTAPFQLIHSFFNDTRTMRIDFSARETTGNLVSYYSFEW